MGHDLYHSDNLGKLGSIKDYAAEPTKAFDNFNSEVFQDGELSVKEKEIIAVAVTHITQCPYCIQIHTGNAKKAGATLEELTEAAYVASAIEAGAAVTHGTNVLQAKSDDAPDALYNASNLDDLKNVAKLDHKSFKAYQAFSAAATEDGKLSKKFKEIVAVAVAIAAQCPYCIKVHTGNALEAGASDKQLGEAIFVASALKAGAPYAHISNMITAYKEA